MRTLNERKHELYRLSLAQLVAEYRRIKCVPKEVPSSQVAGITISQLIETILTSEFPEPMSGQRAH